MSIRICNFIIFLLAFSSSVEAQNPLFIPPVLNGPIYNLNMQHGTHQFYAGNIFTQTMGFNGNILGPTLIMQKEQQVSINVTNSIGEPTTVHWHGFHVAPENDGGPHTVIAPNSTWSPSFKIKNRAATYWYHPHLHDSTSKHVMKGLAGMIIVKDAEEASKTLPRTYGVDDFPLIIQTKYLSMGQILYNGQDINQDNTLMVNATTNPYLTVPKQFVRLRILNASPQRVFNLGLSNNGNLYQIASDGGMLAESEPVTRIKLAPGERAEIAIDFATFPTGFSVQLKSYANELPSGTWGATNAWIGATQPPFYAGNPMNGQVFDVIQFNVNASTTANPILSISNTLSSTIPIHPSQATNTRHKYLFSSNGGVKIGTTPIGSAAAAFNMNTIDDEIRLNTTEIWEIHGATNQYHPFHIHDIQFFILERRDSLNNLIPLTPQEYGMKDVVNVGPKETVKFITKFDDFWSDIPYMYHCHIGVHEDKGMMKQFVVNKNIYVDSYCPPWYIGGCPDESGTTGLPYKTVRKAVLNAVNGSTIYIVGGNNTYNELNYSLLINKKIKIKSTLTVPFILK
jgi:blue copper oxidase